MIAPTRLRQLVALIQSGKESLFYQWPEWKRVRADVLRLDQYECQKCKAEERKYRKAKIVHHVKHLKDRPDLALEIYDGEERQLISVCKDCHEKLHPESQRQYKALKMPITQERWD